MQHLTAGQVKIRVLLPCLDLTQAAVYEPEKRSRTPSFAHPPRSLPKESSSLDEQNLAHLCAFRSHPLGDSDVLSKSFE
jgi:hypothetical protein